MGICIDIAEVRAKKFFLNMLDEDVSKTMWDFGRSIKNELIKDPHNVYKSIDVLWDCNDTVPNWFCQIWKKYSVTESDLSIDISSYSGLMRGIIETVEGIISEELYINAPEYCRSKTNRQYWNCWICKHKKGYKDCKGNSLPELFCLEQLFEKWDVISMEENRELGIRFGRNEDNVKIIECVYCDTKWNEDRDDFLMVTCDGNPLSPKYKEKLKRIKEGMENKKAGWYICPLNCHFMK